MTTLLNHNDECANALQLSFATLTPADVRTSRGMQAVPDAVENQREEMPHHQKFLKRCAGAVAATESPIIPHDTSDLSSGFTTEADRSDDEELSHSETSCYELSLSRDARPHQPEVGFWFGTGDLDRFGTTAGVDLLLPPSNIVNQISLYNTLYPRQGYLAFDPKYAQLWLHARHKGIRVNDRPLAQRSKILLEQRARISIGPYRYVSKFKVFDEKDFQAAKRDYIAQYRFSTDPHQSTSATPSACDICVQDWLLHGVVGSSPVSVIHAATHIKSGEVVAVKRLRFGSTKNNEEKEVHLYDEILASIKTHRNSSFVMQKHSLLRNERQYACTHEVYLLWKPLARGAFSNFGVLGPWRTQSVIVKKKLYVQILLGLLALHECGWIHRDLKPANLGVVDLGEKPYAVIMDEGQAIRQRPQGYEPRIAHCGTIGYLAPELENNAVSLAYDSKVDIWSMGAVGYFLFVAGKVPWSVRFNMFVPAREAHDPSLHLFREARAQLIAQPEANLEHLIGEMLDENPQRRPGVAKILRHPAIRAVCDTIDRDSETWNGAGQKRSRGASCHRIVGGEID